MTSLTCTTSVDIPLRLVLNSILILTTVEKAIDTMLD